MSSVDWSSLPLLPLKCVLDHLKLYDVLSATSTCRNWRQALQLYEGRREKETLALSAQYLEKSAFLTRIFKKHIRRLNIYLDCVGKPLDNFVQLILPKFYDASLQEILFISPGYLGDNEFKLIKLRRPIAENLIHAHRHTLRNLGLFGCELLSLKDNSVEEEHYEECNVRRPSFASDQLLQAKHNLRPQLFSSLNYLAVEYDMLDSEVLEGLSSMPNLLKLTVNIVNKRSLKLEPLQWGTLNRHCPNAKSVEINIIEMPIEKFTDIIENVLVEDLPLIALRVFFCKTIHQPLMKHVTFMYHESLRELHWADAPYDCNNSYKVHVDIDEYDQPCTLNPFILLCWRCTKLEKLVIHGYWIWQYDLLGMVRLRHTTLLQLDVSAIYDEEMRYCNTFDVIPVNPTDRAMPRDNAFIKDINQYLQFTWKPVRRWGMLHPALTSHSTGRDRADYIVQQLMLPFGVP